MYLDTFLRDKWIAGVSRHATDPDLLNSRYSNYIHFDADATPFIFLLRNAIDHYRILEKDSQELVRLWVRCLSDAGVDLVSYGEGEHKLLRGQQEFHESLCEIHGFMNFTYGPDPGDWHVWLRHPGDLYAGMFWELVESERQQLPGAWIEEDYVPLFDTWRQGRCRGRRIGIKRRVLRRLRAKAKHQNFFTGSNAELVDELLICIKEDAESVRKGSESAAQEERMLELAKLLGVTTDEFRHPSNQ